MGLLTFKLGGVHPNPHKETSSMPIEDMPVPGELAILLSQHIGVPCEPVVKKGDVVRAGQVVGEVRQGLGVSVHAPCAGKVVAIAQAGHPVKVSVPAVILDTRTRPEGASSDEVMAGERAQSHEDCRAMTREEMVSRIREAGVVGAGGAGFPTHVKLSPPSGMVITELLVNGAECEPYLTADHRVMVECAADVVEGIAMMMKILGISHAIVGIEDNKPDAVEAMRRAVDDAALDGGQIDVIALKTKYPQGSEKQLIYALTGRKVASGALPASVGVVVQNVSTVLAVAQAIETRQPMVRRVVTVSGSGIRRQGNFRIAVGTRLRDIIDFLGGTTPDVKKIIIGGPMMGFATSDLDTPVTKTTSGIVFLSSREVDRHQGSACIRCGRCLDACPMGLESMMVALYVEAGRGKETTPFGVMDCFECGSCAFVCPAHRPLVQLIRLAKQAVRSSGAGLRK